MVNITKVNLLALASSFDYASQLASLSTSSSLGVQFLSFNDRFVSDILGTNVTSTLIADQPWKAFHEAGVYSHATNSLYVSSNRVDKAINVTILDLANNAVTSARYANVESANGGTAYYPPGTPANSSRGQHILWCDQGNMDHPAQLTLLDPSTNTTKVLVNNYLGRNFTSLNDVRQHYHTGDVWFTDTYYGYWQFFRPSPDLPVQVYRFSPSTGEIQVVADGFTALNGIEFSPNFRTVYITDTGAQEYTANSTRPATIYAYDVTRSGKSLENRRVFAYSDNGLPDGIHTDTRGNVYASCGDGVHVWSPEGVLLGKMLVSGGSANFAFVPGGMIIFNEDKAYKVTIAAQGREVKRDFGLL